jgi:hypothetical protein
MSQKVKHCCPIVVAADTNDGLGRSVRPLISRGCSLVRLPLLQLEFDNRRRVARRGGDLQAARSDDRPCLGSPYTSVLRSGVDTFELGVTCNDWTVDCRSGRPVLYVLYYFCIWRTTLLVWSARVLAAPDAGFCILPECGISSDDAPSNSSCLSSC